MSTCIEQQPSDGQDHDVLMQDLTSDVDGELSRKIFKNRVILYHILTINKPLFVLDSKAIGSLESYGKEDVSCNNQGMLHLMKEINNALSYCWSHRPIHVNRSFVVNFSFMLSSNCRPPADGFAFVIHNDPRGTGAKGNMAKYGGSGLGYSGISNSLAVAFYNYPEHSDHMAMYSNGHGENSGLNQGNTSPFYNAREKTLTSTMDDSFSISAPLDIAKLLSLQDNHFAYVGFTAAGGYYTQNVYIKDCNIRGIDVDYCSQQ
eukprot:gene12477-14643_t